MHDNSEIKEVKRIDPIWKRLRFERIWKLLFLAFMVIYVASSWNSILLKGNNDSPFLYFPLIEAAGPPSMTFFNTTVQV